MIKRQQTLPLIYRERDLCLKESLSSLQEPRQVLSYQHAVQKASASISVCWSRGCIRDTTIKIVSYNRCMMNSPEQDPRVYFAAERTFLAWIRTGLGLMGVGFAVARFGLFLRQMRATETHSPVVGSGLSVWSGVLIVSLGVIVLGSSIAQHFRLVRELSSGTWRPGRISRSAVLLAALLALVGVGMAAYLVILR